MPTSSVDSPGLSSSPFEVSQLHDYASMVTPRPSSRITVVIPSSRPRSVPKPPTVRPPRKEGAPKPSALAAGAIATVEVGPNAKKYNVHKALLVHHSEYFAKALTGSWTEAQTGVVKLDDLEEDTSYVLANRLLVDEFQRHANVAVVAQVWTPYVNMPGFCTAFQYAFKHIQAERTILQLFIDTYCQRGPGTSDLVKYRDLEEDLPAAFLRRVIHSHREVRFDSDVITSRGRYGGVCYVEHGEGQGECQKVHMTWDKKSGLGTFRAS
ncbi:hypothetical protein BU23DRAFT_570673 [Bimuria novae-zelandiae CBS 107.79]|uniref:BTB domain-containing protein n=1 Tax=Bimuria novae-zelandiae CBS 107.79 TaxID=1447943 RepID=A0A6A5UZS2_9PLEO|nr:hypothetical protein BU23DRAFT_570673 [Bimuria novae-zelandiae CBS 107.79]